MAKIFSPPQAVPAHEWDVKKTRQQNQEAEQKYIDNLKKFLQRRRPGNDKIGNVIRFPVADGYAIYMVAGLRPAELLHVPIGDAWEYQYAHRLTMSDILEEIQRQEALSKIFEKKQTA